MMIRDIFEHHRVVPDRLFKKYDFRMQLIEVISIIEFKIKHALTIQDRFSFRTPKKNALACGLIECVGGRRIIL